jgi:hypothetical protein
MGSVPVGLAEALAARLDIHRAVETGTYRAESTVKLASLFRSVETIELSWRFAWRARRRLWRHRNVKVRRGSSAKLLTPASEPTLYWLDGHWSGPGTAGEDFECPLIDELRKTSPGTVLDCYLIDDARLFLAPPPQPHKAEAWPTFEQIKDVVANVRAGHTVGLIEDVIAVVPPQAADLLSRYGRSSAGD